MADGEARYQEFVKKMDILIAAYRKNTAQVTENTIQTKRLIRMLQAAGYRDPQDMERQIRAGVRPAQPAPGASAATIVADHLTRAFTAEDIRSMTEDFIHGLSSRRRRR